MRDRGLVADFFRKLSTNEVYLDFTGLSHHVWAPLVRVGLEEGVTLRAVYIEPSDYRFSVTPTEGEIFDLSERIEGVAPIPGFANLAEPREEDVAFIPLLGFEGTRFAYLLEQVQPPGGAIIPIVGVPGFRAEYPFHTYLGNRQPLTSSGSWKEVRYAIANCPFSVFYTLENINRDLSKALLRIAPIGTKPHALGAVLYATAYSAQTELIYDHPKRKMKRTQGSARCLVYFLSEFMDKYL